jgi:hypothetical protein
MSIVRILALLGLALVLAGLASAAAAPDGRVYAWLTGQCFRDPPPLVCHRNGSRYYGRRYDI